MLLRDRIGTRLADVPQPLAEEGPDVRLPTSMRTAKDGARPAMLARLAASRRFSLGGRAGAAGGRAVRLDLRQRVIVKAMVSRHRGGGPGGTSALLRHVVYLGRLGAGKESARAEFFDAEKAQLRASAAVREWRGDRHHFRLIISPEQGERIADLRGYVREVMGRAAADLSEPKLEWIATCHFDTDQPHAHVLVRGRRADGRDLVIPRSYISFGLRARAQEVAQELLGDLSRSEAERRVWKETEANRFTQLDRRLLEAADGEGLVPDGVGRTDAWSALSRGRLRHLERIGLAVPVQGKYRLARDLEAQLRRAQLRIDVIRTLNQRRLEGAREVRLQLDGPVVGTVVQSGFHDELGARGYVVVRDARGAEHYGSLGGGALPAIGADIRLEPGRNGLASVAPLRRGAEQAI